MILGTGTPISPVPCKEQAGNRRGVPAIVSCSRRLISRSHEKSSSPTRGESTTMTADLAARRRTVRGNFLLTMSNSPSRSRGAFLRPGFATLLHSPRTRGGRSAEKRSGARRNTRGARHNAACQALARRLASHDAGRSPLGAPPWRFWASGPRFRLLGRPPSYNGGQLPSDPCSELLAARS